MDQHRIAGLHAIGAAQQVGGGQALQHHGGSGVESDVFREHQQAVGRDVAHLGVGGSIADLDLADPGADRRHHPGAFEADARLQRQRVEAGAMVDVDEIEPDCMLLDGRLAGGRRRNGKLLPDEDFRAAVLVHANCVGHGCLLSNLLSVVQNAERITAMRLQSTAACV